MRHLLNTLYVFTEDAYIGLDGENAVIRQNEKELGRIPLHTIEGILCFSYRGASPSLMGACAERGIALSFFSPKGRYLAGVHGEDRGNVLLRKTQYACSEDDARSLELARSFIIGKLYNSRWVLERATRDHGMRVDVERLKLASAALGSSIAEIGRCDSLDSLRGIEGEAASRYFGVFDELILRHKESFTFEARRRRPPTDPVNAMLSLFYTVLATDCAAALEGVGLDPYIGFLHADRPGRKSLSLDLMEELRAVMVDRFVISAINNRIIDPTCFDYRESGEVRLSDDGRRALFGSWQERKRDTIVHPFLKEKIPWGLVPHVQALLLARALRGDMDGYPPFMWK